jgi:hypothetical protein
MPAKPSTFNPMEILKHPIRSNWSGYIDGLKMSGQEFYNLLQESIDERAYPDIRFNRVKHKQSRGPFGAKREYLRVKRKEYYFDVCAAHFGNGCFFSYWSFERISLIHRLIYILPIIGKNLVFFLRKRTYYQQDEQSVFLSATHDAVLELVKGQIKQNGLRDLSELEQRPIMYDLKGRRV